MKKSEIVELAGRAGLSPITLERNGITSNATDAEIKAARVKMANKYQIDATKLRKAAFVLCDGLEVNNEQ